MERQMNTYLWNFIKRRWTISSLLLLHFYSLFFYFLLLRGIPISSNLTEVKSSANIGYAGPVPRVTARFNLLLLRTLGGSTGRMKSYLRRATLADQPPYTAIPCSYSMLATWTENYREIERTDDRSLRTRSVINGNLRNRTPASALGGARIDAGRAGETIELVVWG